MDVRGKRFLVIGGAGLIGSHTVEELVKEDVAEIRIFDNFTRGKMENLSEAMKDKRVNVFAAGGDILHTDVLEAALKDIDGVFHFAAMWLLHCWEFPRSAFETNIAGTFNVIDTCAKMRVKRLAFSSSASVYGEAVAEPMTEDHPMNSTTFYGGTKVAGEHMLRSYHYKGKETSQPFDYVGLRYFNVYGPRQDYRGAYVAVVMKMLDRIDKGLPPIIYGDGSQAYDFIYVSDCAAANVCAMKSSATDQVYNVSTGVKTSVKQIAELLFDVTGAPRHIQFEPAEPSFVKNRLGSPDRAARDLDFRAKVQLRQGLEKLVKWRKTHIAEVERRRVEGNA